MKERKIKIGKSKGITLIALVITIIVLLILAGVTIATLTGDNGILNQASKAKTSSVVGEKIEKFDLIANEWAIEKNAGNKNLESFLTDKRNSKEIDDYIKNDGDTYTMKIDGYQRTINETGNMSRIAPTDYGKSVNYTASITNNSTNNKEEINGWRIFYADDRNIYLISNNYVKCSLLATTTNNGIKTNHQVTWSTADANNPRAKFNNILQDYLGSASITTNNPSRKWLSQYLNNRSSTKNNMKAVAYMLDTIAWSEYANDKAEYAIGGPTLELFVASYNNTHTEKLEIEASSDVGYRLKRSTDSEMQNYLGNFNTNDNLYIPAEENGTVTMWLASPSYNSEEEIMVTYSGGYVSNNAISNDSNGFKPLVCLKSSTELKLSSDGSSYEIIE